MENKNRIICKALRYLRKYKSSHTEKEYLKYLADILKNKKTIPIETNRDIDSDMVEFLSKKKNLKFCVDIDSKSTSDIHKFVYNKGKTVKKVGIGATLTAMGAAAVLAAEAKMNKNASADFLTQNKKIVKEIDEEVEDGLKNISVMIEDEEPINKETLGHDYGKIINKETLGHDYGENIIRKREAKKEKILNDFCKCKSIEDILDRQKQLESLNLTSEDKIYPECPLSPEVQWFIYEQSIRHNIPADFTFAIIGVESRGQYNSSGEATYNRSNNSYDLGLTQQNSKSRLPEFQAKYNLTYDEAYNYLKNNDFMNIASAFLYYDEIAIHHKNFSPEEYAGCYNGWLNWRGKRYSIEYVSIFHDYYDEVFTNHHDVTSKARTI